MPFNRTVALAFVVVGIAHMQAGCVDDKRLTLTEAKEVALSIRGQIRNLPPRGVEDIIALVGRPDDNTGRRNEARQRAGAEIRSGSDPTSFHYSRGMAAWEAGLYDQARRDLSQALTTSSQSTIPNANRIRLELGRMQIRSGNYSDGISLIEDSIDSAQRPTPGKTSAPVQLIKEGNLDAAWNSAEELVRGLETTQFLDAAVAEWRPLWLGDIRGIQATILEMRGRPQEAEAYRRQAAELVSDKMADNPAIIAYTRQAKVANAVALASNLRLQGRLAESEFEARQSVHTAVEEFGAISVETVGALGELERVLTAQGRLADAERIGNRSLALAQSSGFAPEALSLARIRTRLGEIAGARGEWQQAFKASEAARIGMDLDRRSYELFLGTNLTRAIAFARNGRLHEAEAIATESVERTKNLLGMDHYDYGESLGVLAMVHALQLNNIEALGEFRRASAILVARKPRSETASDMPADRQARLDAIVNSYLELLFNNRGTDPEANIIEESFQIAELSRNRAIARYVTAAAVRGGIRSPELQNLVRREQDVVREAEALFASLAGQKVDQVTRSRLVRLQAARDAIQAEIVQRFPDYGDLTDPRPPSIATLRSVLGADEVVVAIDVGADRSYVWAISPRTGVQVVQVAMGVATVDKLVKRVRAPMENPLNELGDIQPFDLQAAHSIFAAFLEPIRSTWEGASRLTIVADGPLGFLPFSLLPTSNAPAVRRPGEPMFAEYRRIPWLFRTHSVAVVPSAAALVSLRSQKITPASRPLAGFGDPYFDERHAQETGMKATRQRGLTPAFMRRAIRSVGGNTLDSRKISSARLSNLVRLEETAQEVRAIARALGADENGNVFLGAEANEAQVKSMDLSDRRVLVFATHGLVPGDLDGLYQPALALTNPELAGVEGDGLLTMAEVLDLRLNADWVVLSACNTAAAEGIGAEAVSGLGRAFFYAGTKAVLATHWAVESQSAQLITTSLFAEFGRGTGRAEALRMAMGMVVDREGIMDGGTMVASYAHPLFWAPFALFGDGG